MNKVCDNPSCQWHRAGLSVHKRRAAHVDVRQGDIEYRIERHIFVYIGSQGETEVFLCSACKGAIDFIGGLK